MKKFDLRKIMTRAWEIAVTAVENFGGKKVEYFAESLKSAWAEVKAESTLTVEEKLINAGYKVWEGGNHRRIYINDAEKYVTVERVEKAGIIYGQKDIVIDGVSVWDNVAKARHFNNWVKTIDQPSFGNTIYFDCNTKTWYSDCGSVLEKIVLNAVVKAF